jgi:hypothetical protein
MPLDLPAARRYARHVALPEIGAEGQERVCAGHVVLIGTGLAVETAARYLLAAGAGRVTLLAPNAPPHPVVAHLDATNAERRYRHAAWPRDAVAWVAALDGVDVVVRSGFDDDSLLHAARARGIPVVVARATPGSVDLVSFRHRPRRAGDGLAEAMVDVPPSPAPVADDAQERATEEVLAGTFAAAQALLALVGGDEAEGATHLRLPLDGGEPQVRAIPWPPRTSNK